MVGIFLECRKFGLETIIEEFEKALTMGGRGREREGGEEADDDIRSYLKDVGMFTFFQFQFACETL